jgi:hypothetical protein
LRVEEGSIEIMAKYEISRFINLADLPEFKRLQAVNPGHDIDEVQTIIMFGRAIHWLAMFDILWPPFESIDYYAVEVRYIVSNDPDRSILSDEFYRQVALILKPFWTIRLGDLYPGGDWTVQIHDDPEITVAATIEKRN